MVSCTCRNDYNIVFSIGFLVILSNFYNQNPRISSKIIIHLLLLVSFADILWIILMSFGWRHSSKTNEQEEDIEQFWDSLEVIHKVVYVLAYFELIIKLLLAYYLFSDFKTKQNWKDLLKFNYSFDSSDVEMPQGNNNNEQKGFEDNFENNY